MWTAIKWIFWLYSQIIAWAFLAFLILDPNAPTHGLFTGGLGAIFNLIQVPFHAFWSLL